MFNQFDNEIIKYKCTIFLIKRKIFLRIFKEFHCENLAEKNHNSFFDTENTDSILFSTAARLVFQCLLSSFLKIPIFIFKDTYLLFKRQLSFLRVIIKKTIFLAEKNRLQLGTITYNEIKERKLMFFQEIPRDPESSSGRDDRLLRQPPEVFLKSFFSLSFVTCSQLEVRFKGGHNYKPDKDKYNF